MAKRRTCSGDICLANSFARLEDSLAHYDEVLREKPLRVYLFYRAETGCNEFSRPKNCTSQQKLVLIRCCHMEMRPTVISRRGRRPTPSGEG